MKNVNVLLAVVLCAGLCVLFGLFNRSADESLGWSPNEMYMQSISSGEGASFTSANLSDGNVSNDGVAVSMRNGSFSLRTRVRHTSSPNRLIAPSPSSPIANGVPEKSVDFGGALSPNSLIGHMTSSAEFHSFGGGSNMAMGSYTSSSNNLIASSPAIGSYSPSPSSPIALSPNASGVGFNNLPSLQGGDGGRPVVSAEQALMSASSSVSGIFASALQNTYGTASYGDVYTPNRVNNRFNAPPGAGGDGEGSDEGLGESWLYWLDFYYANTLGYWTGENGDAVTLDWQAAYSAWKAIVDAWNEGMGPAPTWEQFEAWLWTQGGAHTTNDRTYTYVPIGDILPLVLMAILYMIILFVKRNKTAQL